MRRNIALIGCGAIARAFYLPALVKLRGEFERIWLVDPRNVADCIASFGVRAQHARLLSDIDDEIEMAIVATPNNLHFPIAREALYRGAHVLIEKPFVVEPEDGRQLLAVAAASNRIIAVNQTRRLFPLTRELRHRINAGEFGSLNSIVHSEGTKLKWPFESGAAFARGARRTGVIMDFGVHVVDFYHYLLQPRWELVSAIHDGFDGPEGLAELSLRAGDGRVSIRLSRYYPQNNVAGLKFDRAELSFNVYDAARYTVRWHSGMAADQVAARVDENVSHAEALLQNFLAAIEGRAAPVCDGASSLPVIEILDQAYQHAQQYSSELGAV